MFISTPENCLLLILVVIIIAMILRSMSAINQSIHELKVLVSKIKESNNIQELKTGSGENSRMDRSYYRFRTDWRDFDSSRVI